MPHDLIQEFKAAQSAVLKERDDLQSLLRTQIEVLGDELYVMTEGFGDWEDSRRRDSFVGTARRQASMPR